MSICFFLIPPPRRVPLIFQKVSSFWSRGQTSLVQKNQMRGTEMTSIAGTHRMYAKVFSGVEFIVLVINILYSYVQCAFCVWAAFRGVQTRTREYCTVTMKHEYCNDESTNREVEGQMKSSELNAMRSGSGRTDGTLQMYCASVPCGQSE